MHSLRYVNASNVSVALNDEKNAWTNLDSLRSYVWEHDTSRRPNGNGGKANNFGRWPKEYTFQTAITCNSRQELEQWQDDLQAVTEPDIFAHKPGRLYIDNQYMTCYIKGASTEQYNAHGCFAIVTYTVLAVEPYWCTEVLYTFSETDAEPDTTGKKYNLRYAYRYGTGLVTRLINQHYTACPAIITIYGACINPSVTLAGVVRQVNVTLLASERLVIDGIEHTIYKVNSSGVKTNVFNNRNKNYDIFAEIPAGEVTFFGGDFKMDILLVQQRSMPKWKS